MIHKMKNIKLSENERIKRLKIYMMISYSAIIAIAMFTISILAINKTDAALKNKVSSMTSALNTQMKMNINSYLQRMETTCTLVFASDEVYKYDATNKNNDEYDSLKTEDAIEDKLYSICIMENFVDFGIVYSNNHIVGKLSNGTVKLFGDNLYTDLSAMINRQRTDDGWATGYNGNFTRIYYVKRINDNAVLVSSFYTTELEDVFEHPGGINDMTVQLLEKNYVVIYSSDKEQNGKTLSPDIYNRVKNVHSLTSLDDEYLVTINDCGDNWYVVCSIPTSIILNEKNEVAYYIYIIGFIAIIIAILLSIWILEKMINPVNKMVTTLDNKARNDLLTGVLNKRSFEESVDQILAKADINKYSAVILLDVDNFKGVNDTLGHAYGDKVLANIGKILTMVFNTENCIGRLGGDEFCVFLNIPSSQQEHYHEYINVKCIELSHAFKNNYTGDDNDYKVSVSIGVSIFPTNGQGFSKLYRCADQALYISKHKGKDTYSIFKQITDEDDQEAIK